MTFGLEFFESADDLVQWGLRMLLLGVVSFLFVWLAGFVLSRASFVVTKDAELKVHFGFYFLLFGKPYPELTPVPFIRTDSAIGKVWVIHRTSPSLQVLDSSVSSIVNSSQNLTPHSQVKIATAIA